MAEDGVPPKEKINRWVLEPLFANPAYLTLLLVLTLALFTFGSISTGLANTTCLAFLAMAGAFMVGFIAFIIWKSRD